ncbi:MAG: winged helix-turn-helix domain-containing protein [Candidatus Woesearchaeota archaeon]
MAAKKTLKRDKIQVIADILRAIQAKNGRIKPTHIMYKANLSHTMMNEYLAELQKNDLIVQVQTKTSRSYQLTEKGFEFLSRYKMIGEFLDTFGIN